MTTKHTYEALILADSISPAGHRLTTMEVTLPRFVLAEFNTHRQFSRNSASSRAIPVEKRIAAVREHPFVPESFGRNKAGMQATEYVTGLEMERAREAWLYAAEQACLQAENLAELGVHKQLANRLLEPFMWTTVIITATDWANFFAQRCHPDAQPEIRIAAELMRSAMENNTPWPVEEGQWHLPLVGEKYGDEVDTLVDIGTEGWAKISAARCARVSYLTHDGRRDLNEDLKLYDRLTSSGHMSPLEHPARPMTQEELHWFRTQTLGRYSGGYDGPLDIGSYLGNLNGWVSLRKTIPNERVFQGGPK